MDCDVIQTLRQDALEISRYAVSRALPDAAVKEALSTMPPVSGCTILVAIGKAAWSMANAACNTLGNTIQKGVVITKYEQSRGPLENCRIFEAGHPVPDGNGVTAAEYALELVNNLSADDRVLFLVSGGGSALFELPLVPLEELEDITRQLLACGADIGQINTIRKRLSGVKGGRFGQACAPAQVYSIVLSDVIGDPPDVIASGPAYPDGSTSAMAREIVDRYNLRLSSEARMLLEQETPKFLPHVTTMIVGGVTCLCMDAQRHSEKLGYATIFLTSCLQCEAREAGRFLSSIAKTNAAEKKPVAYILGGETVVHLTGNGKGGRNQELALAAAAGINGLNAVVISVGSDGTDGPTDAAGGIVDGTTADRLRTQGISLEKVLADNNSYYALEKSGGLVITGPTGTNVNDLTMLLMR